MWKPVAAELGIPWRTAEGMHWIIGEQEMARRANVHPFSTTLQPSPSSTNNGTLSHQTNDHLGRSQRSYIPINPFEEHEAPPLQSPAILHANYHGSMSGLSVPLPPLGPSSVQNLARPTEMADDSYSGSAHPHTEGGAGPDMDPSKSSSLNFYHHFNEVQQPGAENCTPALLPSVAELEGGVSPFTLPSERKGSTSSNASGARSSNGRISPAYKATNASDSRHGPR